MIRGVIAATVFNKVNERGITNVDDSAALTLMSSDVERIVTGLNVIHETWANVVEAGIGIYLLERQITHTALIALGVALGRSTLLEYLFISLDHVAKYVIFSSLRCCGRCSSLHGR